MLAGRHSASTTVGRGVRESGIHALHSAGRCCRYVVALAEANATWRGGPNNRPLPLGFMLMLSRRFPSVGSRLTACGLVRESNP